MDWPPLIIQIKRFGKLDANDTDTSCGIVRKR